MATERAVAKAKHKDHNHTHGTDSGSHEARRDPVCGMPVDSGTGKPSATYEGRTYHFCSEACRSKFLAAPGDYETAEDPVCGMKVGRATAKHFVRHEGQEIGRASCRERV